MNHKIKKIIKEEIGNYYQDLPIRLFNNIDFQKQFISDSIYNKKIKVELVEDFISTQWEENDSDYFSIDVVYNVEYQYVPEKKVFFVIVFYSDRVPYSIETIPDKGDRYTPPQPDSYFSNIDFIEINVELLTPNQDEIDFTAFEEADPNTKEDFIKSFIKEYIEDKTNIPIKNQ